MKRILAFGASTSSTSINKQLAHYAAHQIKGANLSLIDLNDFEAPLFSVDLERENGIPESAKRFKTSIDQSDGIVISLAEHNSNFAAAFKNLTDWVSRMDGKVWSEKKMFLLSTSTGARGGKSVHDLAMSLYPRHGAIITAAFSLPSFNENFAHEGITDPELAQSFSEQLALFVGSL